MKKKITVAEFATELVSRIENNKTIDCCRDELINLASIAKKRIGHEMVEVNWKD